MNSKFNEGVESTYADLPVQVNYLYWKRGNGQLEHLKEKDPGAFFGGFSAMVVDSEGNKLPTLHIPIVTRKSDDGKATYQRYATNVIHLLPIASRMRYELREKQFNTKRQRDEEKVVSVAREYVSGVTKGYQPMKQVFGLVYSPDGSTSAPAVLKIDKWSSFISFNKAVGVWMKVKVEDGEILVRRYGTVGASDKDGNIFPNFESFNDGKSTPIEAIDVQYPMVVKITPEIDKLWEDSQAWAKCEKWHPSAKVQELAPEIHNIEEQNQFGEPEF